MRAEPNGFYARLQPTPRIEAPKVVAVVLVFGSVGAVIALLATPQPEVRAWIVGGSVFFGLLLSAVIFGQGFFPLEIVGDERALSWSGERYAWAQLGGCVAEGGRLQLRSIDDRVLATADHLEPEAARWIAQVIAVSLHDEAPGEE